MKPTKLTRPDGPDVEAQPPPIPAQPTPEPARSDALGRFAAKYSLPLILLLLLGALALRASDLKADPPWYLSWSTGTYTDEALNTYSARNMVLYGRWRVDDFFPLVIYPLVNYLTVLILKFLGFGFVQMKLLSLLAGVASVLVIYLLVKEDAGHLAGLLAGLAFATCFPLIMYSRLGLVEMVQILFLLMTGLFYVHGLKHPRQMALAGFLGASTILLVKISAAFIVPTLAAAVGWELFSVRRDRGAVRALARGIGWGLLGIGVAAIIWLVVVFLPHRSDYFQYVSRHSLASPFGHPRSVFEYLSNTFTVGLVSGLMPRLSWVALIGFVALPMLALGRRPAFRYLGLWFTLALVMLGYMNYRPDRYELVLLPALIAGFAAALARLLEGGTLVPALKPTVPKTILYSLWIWPLAAQAWIYTNRLWGMLRIESDLGIIGCALLGALVTGFAGYVLLKLRPRGIDLRPVVARVLVAALALALALRMDFVQYFRWFNNRTHSLVTCARDMDAILPEGAVLAGAWAPELLSGSRKRALVITDWANTEDPVRRYGVTHLVSPENGFDEELFWKLYPEMMARPRDKWRGQVGDIVLYVYELAGDGGRPLLPKPVP